MDEPCEDGATPAELLAAIEGEYALELFWYAHDGSTVTSSPAGDTTETVTMTVAHVDGELRCVSACGGNEGPVVPGHLELDLRVSWVSESGALDETFAVTFVQEGPEEEPGLEGAYEIRVEPSALGGTYAIALSDEGYTDLMVAFIGELGGQFDPQGTVYAWANNGIVEERLELLAAVYEPE